MKRAVVRIAKGVGIFYAVLALLFVGLVISGSWINPFEKSAMRQCLLDIDKVRQFRGVNSPEYYSQVEKTKADLGVCRKRAVTIYDHQLIPLLEINLDSALREQRMWQLPDTSPAKKKMLDLATNSDSMVDRTLREHIK